MQDANETTVKISADYLRALATATTKYYEASPEGHEYARVEYELALTRFNTARASVTAVPADITR